MFPSIMIVVVIVCIMLFVFYKRDMLLGIFSTNLTSSTQQLQEQLEQTADVVIKRLEEQITHLEYLLEEANSKIISLDNKIQDVDNYLKKANAKEYKEIEEYKKITYLEEVLKETNSYNNPINNIAMVTNEIANLSIEDYKDMARNDKRSSIIAMTELGYDVNQIAQTTGISKGEIMLLLQLNKK